MSEATDPRAVLLGREVIVEIEVVGAYARAIAVDGETGREVIAIGPATATRHDLERLATGKLARVLARELGGSDKPGKPGLLT